MSIALKSYGTQLAEVQDAISAVLVNQSYSINGREFSRANLDELNRREKYLTKQLSIHGDVIVGKSTARGSAQVSFA